MAQTDGNKTLNNKIRKLAPEAIETMGELLREPTTPAPTKAQLIGFILERTLGKPDTTINLNTGGCSIRDSENRLIAIGEEIRREMEDEAASIPETAVEPEDSDMEDEDEEGDQDSDEDCSEE